MSTPALAALDWLRARHLSAPPRDLCSDSRAVQPGDVFAAMPSVVAGRGVDGRAFVDAAVGRGAVAVLVEADGWSGRDLGVPVLPVPRLRRESGPIAAAFYGTRALDLRRIGVTGTNGKTSCSQWIAQLLTLTGLRCAVIGTLGIGFPGEQLADTGLTTPDAIAVQRALRALADRGARAVALEASSIGLDQGRVDGVDFSVALFTNLTRDHIDYHGTMVRYEAAKSLLFDEPALTHAVINLDDPAGLRMLRQSRARGLHLTGYALRAHPDTKVDRLLEAASARATRSGQVFELRCDGARAGEIAVPLVGAFNVANLLGVIGCALACGRGMDDIVALAPKLAAPPGRMQCVGGADAPLVVIDYSHTPDALDKALAALRPLARARDGKLWIVFGAGGDRDRGKRVSMGAIAARGADEVIVTSDNPRGEDPGRIAAAIIGGIPGRHQCILDRAEAIAAAVSGAADADVVLVAGKGHEQYQEISGAKRPFSDIEQARAALARRAPPQTGAGS